MSKNQAESLGSRLKTRSLPGGRGEETKCSVFSNCEKDLASFFSVNGDISY